MITTNRTVAGIKFTRREMTVLFSDGRKVTAPLAWYHRLLSASEKQREHWEELGQGRGIHWPDVDEDLSIEGILHGIPAREYQVLVHGDQPSA